jgi:hypothetical protein
MRETFHGKYRARNSGYVHLPGFSDRGFEQFVFDALLQSLAGQDVDFGACRVDLTPRSADRGRDVTITNFTASALLGFQFSQPQSQTIIVECKLVGGQRLNFEHVAANVLQLESSGPATFLLVTNASLTPRALTLIQDHCDRIGIRFLLIDGYNFDRHFPGAGEYRGRADNTDDTSPIPTLAQLQVSYQVFRNIEPSGAGFTVHVAVRSFGQGAMATGIALHSTRDWTDISNLKKGRSLYGDDLACFTLRLIPKRARVKDTVKLALTVDGRPDLFDAKLSGNDDFVDLPLFGNFMLDAVQSYDRRLRTGLAPAVLHLHAPSGTGKTRFLNEIARRVGFVGDGLSWFRLRDDGTAVVQVPGARVPSKKRLHTITQEEMLRQVRAQSAIASRLVLIFIDDLHVAKNETIDAIEAIVFDPGERPRLILAGRSDPLFRQARYEAFARLLKEVGSSPRHEQLNFESLTNDEVMATLGSLIPSQVIEPLSALTHITSIRPVDLVHYIHSLLERGFIYWVDENKLAVNHDQSNILNGAPLMSALSSEILIYRFEYLDGVRLGGFTLSDVFALLALIDNPKLTFTILERLRAHQGVSSELLAYWFEEEPSIKVAFLAHDTIREFLAKHFYSFDKQRAFTEILQYFPEIAQELSPLQLAAVRLHERDIPGAVPALAKLAKGMRRVKNISCLSLEDIAYEDLSSLLFVLTHKARPSSIVLSRTLIARAYLNMHARDFVDGLLDCINLLALIDGFERTDSTRLMRLSVRQLLAHGILNSGDQRTALTLMQEVENSIQEMDASSAAGAVEFDMCDRLQSYYMQQSAFELARSFLFRGRARAYRTGDQSLINISLSAEFHLHRYLDAEEGLRMAVRQRRHADEHAPLRLKLHAQINEAAALWARHGAVAPEGILETLDAVRSTSERSGFGHLVPRIDYLKALNAYHRLESVDGDEREVTELIVKTQRSALRYGYSEYNWLAENLRLLYEIDRGADALVVENMAHRLVEELARDGLTFIAEDYLCYQNVIVLSNVLRALYTFTDEAKAWSAAEKVCFSPLMCSTREERERRLRDIFAGRLACRNYDPRTISVNRQGYFTILV